MSAETMDQIALAERLARMEVKIDVIAENVKKHSDTSEKLESRIAALEARMNRAAGMALAGGGILGALSSWIIDMVMK